MLPNHEQNCGDDKRARTRAALNASVQALEDRRLFAMNAGLAGLVLNIDGDNTANDIHVANMAGNLQVWNENTGVKIWEGAAAGVTEIRVKTFLDNDNVWIGSTIYPGRGDQGVSVPCSLEGGDGHDTLWGGHGPDTLSGGSGNDYLGDPAGTNILRGGDDNDHLNGGAGNDELYGEGGVDNLWDNNFDGGNGDVDKLDGGAEHDYLTCTDGDNSDTLTGGEGDDDIAGDPGDTINQ